MTHITFLVAWLFSLPAFNKKMPFYIFTFWILLLFLSLRYDYGNDYWSYYYKHQYQYIGPESFWEQKEILYLYLNSIVTNFYWLVALISIFYIFTFHHLIKRNLKVKYYWIAILIWLINPYLFLVHLSSLRQTIALCFVIFAIDFAVKRKLLGYIILIIIATGFHQSAIIMLPVYFLLSEKKLSKKFIFITFGILALMLATPLFEMILNWALRYFPKYSMYVEMGLQNSLRSTIMTSILFLFIIFNINKLEGKELVYGKLALFATSIALLSIKFNMIGRVGMYFDVFLIIAIPLILSRLKLMASKQLILIVVILIYALRYVSFFTNNPAYLDYHTILNM